MIFGKDRMMKKDVCAVLVFVFLFAVPVFSADKLYDGFKNPPAAARPVIQWNWEGNKPGEKEIISRLDALKKAGFGGVEITIGEDVNAQLFKFAADAAKKREMIVDVSLGSALGGSFITPAEQGQQITISKKQFTGPVNTVVNIKDLIKISDPNNKQLFLRLIKTGVNKYSPGQELIDKIKPDGSVVIDINDSNNYTLYAGVLRPAVTATGAPALDLFNKQAVEKYFKTICSKLSPAPGVKLGDSIHSIVCPSADLAAINWGNYFNDRFNKQYGYDLGMYLPVILDNNLPVERTSFYDFARRTRFDFYAFLANIYRDSFSNTFQKFCSDNGVMSCVPMGPVSILDVCSVPADIIRAYVSPGTLAGAGRSIWDRIASSAAHLSDKPQVTGELMSVTAGSLESLKSSDDAAFISGINREVLTGDCFASGQNRLRSYIEKWTGPNARLSYLFQNARYQARIAVICPRGDFWSECGPSASGMAGHFWYLAGLLDALNQNGYTVELVSEKIFPETTFEGGKLHYGSYAYDAVLVPDMFSVEFTTAKALRFFAVNGGKVVFIGIRPMTTAGFKEFLPKSIGIDVTMKHIEKNDPNHVLFITAPEKDKDNLLTWTAELMKLMKVLPTAGISSPSDKILFTHYLAEDRDIFYFVNTDKNDVSFRAQFDTAGKIPWVWNPGTGERKKFAQRGKSGELNISIKHGETLLLVFEPDAKAKKAK
jgi:hypothetical protein